MTPDTPLCSSIVYLTSGVMALYIALTSAPGCCPMNTLLGLIIL